MLSVFGPVPDDLAWFFGIAGLLGLVVAVVALVPWGQMLWGRPHVQFGEFGTASKDNSKSLVIYLYNREVQSKWLRWLGVRRELAHIEGVYSITELGSEQSFLSQAPMFGQFGDQRDSTIALKPTRIPLQVPLITCEGDDIGRAKAKTHGPITREIPQGSYRMDVEIDYGGGKIASVNREFQVGNTWEKLSWV